MSNLPIILRLLQTVLSVVTLSMIATGFAKIAPDTEQGLATQLGSSEFNFLLLLSFVSWISTGGWFIGSHFMQMRQPSKKASMFFDAGFIITLLIGGITAAASDYVSQCSRYNTDDITFLRCTNLKLAVAGSFLLCASFVVSFIMRMLPSFNDNSSSEYDDNSSEPKEYRQKSSPKRKTKPDPRDTNFSIVSDLSSIA